MDELDIDPVAGHGPDRQRRTSAQAMRASTLSWPLGNAKLDDAVRIDSADDSAVDQDAAWTSCVSAWRIIADAGIGGHGLVSSGHFRPRLTKPGAQAAPAAGDEQQPASSGDNKPTP